MNRPIAPGLLLQESRKVCLNIWEAGISHGLLVVCDRELRDGRPHSGVHMSRAAAGGRIEWWGVGLAQSQAITGSLR